MSTYPFLSKEWIQAAEDLRDKHADETPPVAMPVKLNVNITDLPDDVDHPELDQLDNRPVVRGHIDTSSNSIVVQQGHMDEPDVTLTTDYETAKAAFVTQDQQQLMEAFLGGKVLVEGDATKLMAMQAPPADPELAARAEDIYREVRAFTQL